LSLFCCEKHNDITTIILFYLCLLQRSRWQLLLSFFMFVLLQKIWWQQFCPFLLIFVWKEEDNDFFNPFATNKVIITMSSSSSFQIEKIRRQ
jgi:hypothetical protein